MDLSRSSGAGLRVFYTAKFTAVFAGGAGVITGAFSPAVTRKVITTKAAPRTFSAAGFIFVCRATAVGTVFSLITGAGSGTADRCIGLGVGEIRAAAIAGVGVVAHAA